jgi:hypothetical protein
MLMAFLILGFYDVRKDFKRIKTPPANDTTKLDLEPYPPKFAQRAGWVTILTFSLQLSNFLIGDPSHDAKQIKRVRRKKPFSNFIAHIAIMAVITYAYLDSLALWDDYSHNSAFSKHSSAVLRGQINRFLGSAFLMAKLWTSLALYTYYLPCLLLLLPLIYLPSQRYNLLMSPLALPEPYGSPSAVWTPGQEHSSWGIRAFWGTFWHQNMRYITSTPGIAIANGLGLPRKNMARYILVTTSAFFFSGLIHAGMVPQEPLGTNYTAWQLRLRIASFFWLQPIGIAVEVWIDSIRHRKTNASAHANGDTKQQANGTKDKSSPVQTSPWVKLLIFCWTSVFLAVTAWHTGRIVGRELGWWEIHPAPISLAAWYKGDPAWYRQWI